MKRFLTPVATMLLTLPGNLVAQQAPTLEELVESALKKDHHLANRQLDIEASQINRRQLTEAYLPHLDLSGKYAYLSSGLNVKAPTNSVPEMGIALPPMDDAFTNRANLLTGGLKTEVLLYSGGKVPNLAKALDQKITAQTAMLEKDRQEVIGEITAAYDQLALLKQVKAVLDESEKRLAINAETAEKALGYGLITPYEHQKIDVARAQLESRIQQYEGKRYLLINLLHQYSGLDTARIALIDHDLQPAYPEQTGSDIGNRPEITALNAGILAHQYQIKAAQSWWKPKVQASASLGYLNAFDVRFRAREPFPTGNTMALTTDKFEIVPNFSVGVGFKWDLFDGNKGKREIQHARIGLQKAVNEKAEAMEKLELNLLKNQTEYTNALAEVRVRSKQKEAAQNALNQAGKEFKTGLIKASDLVGAEADYQNASLDYLQAVYNQRRTVVGLLQATGSLRVKSLQ